ncbi:MAG: NAD(P)-dependent oxidoreductase [Pseudolabrys sp.]|nr:NAD(P)-dependent oxidoreductase [Pseudolabrys sp.]
MNSILVTGAAGLVGGAVVRRLASDGHAVVATDARKADQPDGVRFETIDLSDRPALAALHQQHAVHTVIHCGAISGPMVAADDPHRVLATNVGGTLNLAEAARKAGVRRFVALSSVSVYGDQTSLDPVTEAAPLNAIDVYGASKIAMEAVLRAYRYDLGLPAFVLRLASVYGPGRQTDCFIRDLIRNAADGSEMSLSPEEGFRRQFVHIDDVVHAIVRAAATGTVADFAYNIGGGEWLTEREVAALAALSLPHLRISAVPAPARSIDGYIGVLDYSRATAAFGYRPTIDIRHGIASYADYLAAKVH